jgi:hypothetical protein
LPDPKPHGQQSDARNPKEDRHNLDGGTESGQSSLWPRERILRRKTSRIEPQNVPLTRPSDTLSPSEGERDGVRGRFVGRVGTACPHFALRRRAVLSPMRRFRGSSLGL